MVTRKIKLCLQYIHIGFKSIANYKLSNIMNIVSTLLFMGLQYYLWSNIYAQNPNVSMSSKQGIEYIIFAQLLYVVYPNNVSQDIARMVRSGDIIFYLLKPFPIFLQLLLEEIGKSLFRCFRLIIILIVAYLLFSLDTFSLTKILVFVLIVCSTYIITFFIEVIFGLVSFFTKSFWGINSVKYAIITFFAARIIPISFYPLIIKNMINYLPFKYMYIFPISYLQGIETLEVNQIMLLIINIAVLYFVAYLIYKIGVRKLEIQGG